MKYEIGSIGKLFFYAISFMVMIEFLKTPESAMITIPLKVFWALMFLALVTTRGYKM